MVLLQKYCLKAETTSVVKHPQRCHDDLSWEIRNSTFSCICTTFHFHWVELLCNTRTVVMTYLHLLGSWTALQQDPSSQRAQFCWCLDSASQYCCSRWTAARSKGKGKGKGGGLHTPLTQQIFHLTFPLPAGPITIWPYLILIFHVTVDTPTPQRPDG